jgi:hypothetical protein
MAFQQNDDRVPYMTRFRTLLAAAALATLAAVSLPAAAAKAEGAAHCYRQDDPARCFMALAKKMLARVADADERADAISEMLYTAAIMQAEDKPLRDEARTLAGSDAVKPVRRMDLLYSIDLHASAVSSPAEESYAAALKGFAAFENQLKGGELVELYVNACSIIGWQEPFRERWLDFAQSVCTPEKLKALDAQGTVHQALVLSMMPVAMTLAEDRDTFAIAAEVALSWLEGAEKLADKSKQSADKDFVAFVGVLMHTMDSLCLDAFDEPDAADSEVEQARKTLRRMEARTGISGRSSAMRRQVLESMFDTGRQEEAKKMLRQMLVRMDADSDGKKIPLAEQVAILSLAARLDYEERTDQGESDAPEGAISI